MRRGDPWTEVVPAPCKIVIDAVGISDVSGSSEGNVKPPNVLFASAESGTSQELKKVLIKIYCIKKCLLDLDPI